MGSSLFGGGTSKQASTSNSTQATNQNYNSSSQTQQNQASTGSSNPAAWQMPFLGQGLSQANELLVNDKTIGLGAGTPTLHYAGLNLGPYNQAAGWATGTGIPNADYLSSLGINNAGALTSATNAANSVYDRSSVDPTQANISDAGLYANNPYTQGMITAAQTPIERQLNEVAIPGLNAAAAGTGNDMSSRAGTAEAILRRNAGTDEANIAANILGSQYSNGLNLAENARVANNSAGLNSAGILSGVGSTGANMATAGNGLALSDWQLPTNAAQMAYTDANAGNQVTYNNAMNNLQVPWQKLQNYWNIVGRPLGYDTTNALTGATNFAQAGQSQGTTNTQGNTQGSATQPGPGILGGVGGLLSGIASFF